MRLWLSGFAGPEQDDTGEPGKGFLERNWRYQGDLVLLYNVINTKMIRYLQATYLDCKDPKISYFHCDLNHFTEKNVLV